MDPKNPILKDKVERKAEVMDIILSLNSLSLTNEYPPINKLYKIMYKYINEGGKIKINIPCEMINKRIKGILPDTVNEKCWVKLIDEKFN